MKFISSITLLAAASLIAACVTNEKDPTVIAEAKAYSREGQTAYREGRLDDSAEAYGQALKLHHSIDEPTGIVRDLINLAVVSKAAAKPSDAADCLDAIDRYVAMLDSSSGGSPHSEDLNELLIEAGWMRAYLYCDQGKASAARAHLSQTTHRYGQPNRKLAGRFLNLEARLDLEQGKPNEALSKSTQALKANQRAGDKNEIGDSHRFIARSHLALGDPHSAQASFAEALEMDRQQGRPSKVVDDLLGISESYKAAGQTVQAAAVADRALTAARAAGDPSGEAKAIALKRSL